MYNSDFKNIDINNIQREIQKCLDAVDVLKEDLERNKYNAHPIYLIKVSESLASAAESFAIYFNILRDHQLQFPEIHIERAKQAAKTLEEQKKQRFSFRGN